VRVNEREKFLRMLQLQDAVNERVTPGWILVPRPWYRAMWVEAGELVGDHHGDWIWWKKKPINLAQCAIEVIDILHFGLSDIAQTYAIVGRTDPFERGADAMVVAYFAARKKGGAPEKDIPDLCERLVIETIKEKLFALPEFFDLAFACQMDLDKIYRTYVGKAVLNIFRQDHGYKEGTYRKIWGGEEDNVHLERISARLAVDAEFEVALREQLDWMYRSSAPAGEVHAARP
jgi:dimeric dUTPase (all-alpha-NTP-PPase superfamily)